MSVAVGALRRGSLNRWGMILVAVLIVLAGAWTALWFYAASQAQAEADAWLAREASLGRRWTCPDRQISGYPFTMQLTCTGPHYAGRDGEGSVVAFRAHAEVWSPARITAEADGPLVLQSADGTRHVQANWAAASIVLSGSPSALQSAQIELDQPDIGLTASNVETSVKAEHALFDLQPSETSDAEDRIFDLHLKLDNAALPLIDPFTGNDAPVNFEAQATINALDLGGKGTPPERLEAWRSNDGAVQIDDLVFSKGTMKLAAQGRLALDPEHRPSGKIDLSMIGMEPLMTAFHVPAQILSVTALLGGKPVGHLTGEGKSLNVTLKLADGEVAVGPLKVSRLRPLY
ncbi:DUF2125 domain-containing protein [Methylovirgula sp. 4M-Z18]|uniref:DUF2125 domain-containing protein n=1 Tax=Methylovirgula sp. 4M-Z18 TaxID=2293567 RepID=UPI00131478D5|nr:DUF2125 domain-containing protein [Methylovirgula sp. 4M-Z18]